MIKVNPEKGKEGGSRENYQRKTVKQATVLSCFTESKILFNVRHNFYYTYN